MGVERKKSIYVGEYEHSVDGKGRITIPSKWRFRGDHLEEVYLAMPHPRGYIMLYPPRMIERLEETISEMGMVDEGHEDLMDLFGQSDYVGCDKQGRIILNDSLRSHADIKKEAVLRGTLTTFTIWSPQRWKDRNPLDLESLHKILGTLQV